MAASPETDVAEPPPGADAARADGTVPIGSVQWRSVSSIRGRVRSMRVQPWADTPALECVVVDETGGLLLVFLGRRKIAGLDLGRHVRASGMVGQSRGYLAMMNPDLELL